MTEALPVDTAATLDAAAPELPKWAAVVSLGLGVFGLVTAEFLPASLLTPIASDLNISLGAAGQTVTATALVAAVAAPTVAVVTARVDRRKVMLGFTFLLIVSNLLAAIASDLAVLLVSRVLLGISLGGFWSLAAATTMRLVPTTLFARAMSIILTGVSFATVCAAPVGAWLGELLGWRSAFLCAAGVAGVTLLVQVVTIPRLPPVAASGLRALRDVFGRREIRWGLLAVLLIICGHFAGFTYIRPFLERVAAFDVGAISATLLAFGIGGFFGNLLGALIAERSDKLAVTVGAFAIAAVALALVAAGHIPAVAGIGVAIWGAAFGALPVAFQAWIVRIAPDHAEAAGGLLVMTFQVAIASGAILGGALVDGFGTLGVISFCGLAALAGAALVTANKRSVSSRDAR